MDDFKYEVGDVITKFSESVMANLRSQTPTPILGKEKLGANHYLILYPRGWRLCDDHYLDKSERKLLLSRYGENVRAFWVEEREIAEVYSVSVSSVVQPDQHHVQIKSLDKDSSLYDFYQSDLRQRIKQEEEQRPKNSAFEFL